MMKKIVSLLLCFLIILSTNSAFAGKGKEHETDLEKILLGRTLTKESKDPKNYGNTPAVLFGYLEDAIYLCIDQMGGEGDEWLKELTNDFQVEGLPKSISEFSVPEYQHERYTHLGWDYKDYPKQEAWEIRQNILLATVSKVFGFPTNEDKVGNERYDQKCIQMSKLIYYIHILGDHAKNSLATTTERIQLRNSSKTRGEIEKGLINELRDVISELLWNQRTSMKYNRLRVKLNLARFQSWANGEEDSKVKHERVQDIAKRTIEYLQPQLREMLLEMDFYKRVFSSIVINN